MSDPVASHITATLTTFDTLVRNGLRDGDVLEKVKAKFPEIKKFYRDCAELTEPAQRAAFKASFFLHSFIRDYKPKKDNPTFLDDQRLQLASYDSKKARSAPRPDTTTQRKSPPVDVLPTAPRVATPPPITMPAPVTKIRDSRKSENDSQDYDTQKKKPPRKIILPTVPRGTRAPSPPPFGKAGPGPRTMEFRGFRDIDGSQSSEDEKEKDTEEQTAPVDDNVIKVKRRESVKVTRYEDRGDSDASSGSSWRMKKKNPRKTVAQEKKRDEESSKPRQTPVEKKREENPVVPTGELYDPPCSACRLAGRVCEKQGLGTACAACRRSKHRCEYSRDKRRAAKSKPDVLSADENSDAPDDAPSRLAAKVATKAITRAIEDIEAAPGPAKKKTAAKSKAVEGNVEKKSTSTRLNEVLERVDKLTTLVEKLSHFLGIPADAVLGQVSKTSADIPADAVVGQVSKTYADKSVDMEITKTYADKSVEKETSIESDTPEKFSSTPHVNLVQATPLNSQETSSSQPLQLHPTPRHAPPLMPIAVSSTSADRSADISVDPPRLPFSLPSVDPAPEVLTLDSAGQHLSTSPDHNEFGSSDKDITTLVSADRPPTTPTTDMGLPADTPVENTADKPLDKKGSKTKSSLAAPGRTLVVPGFTPPRTRSRSRSGSPGRVDKRKAEDEPLTDTDVKRRKV